MESKSITWDLVIGIATGFALGLFVGTVALCCNRIRRRRCRRIQSRRSISALKETAAGKGVSNGGVGSRNTTTTVSELSNLGQDSPRNSEWTNMPMWLEGLRRKSVVSACGIPKYYFRCGAILQGKNSSAGEGYLAWWVGLYGSSAW